MMIEVTVLNWLNTHAGVPAYMEMPEGKDKPKRFLLLRKAGSGREDYLNRTSFTIQSYAESMFQAASLNDKVKAVMDDIIELDEVTSSDLDSDYEYSDEETKEYRYQAVYDLYHY